MRARLMVGAAIVLGVVSPVAPSPIANAGGGACQILINGESSVNVTFDPRIFQPGWNPEEVIDFFDPPSLQLSIMNPPDPFFGHVSVLLDGVEVAEFVESSGPPPGDVGGIESLFFYMQMLSILFDDLGIPNDAFLDLITNPSTYPIVVQIGAGSESDVDCSATVSFQVARRPLIDVDPGFLDHYRARVEESELPNTL